jgi:SAM-dependent methyltransferase
MDTEASLPGRAELALAPEIMDGALPYPEARRALRDLDRVNRLLLGVTAVRRMLLPRLAESANGPVGPVGKGPLRVLDLGAGSGNLARALAAAAGRRGTPVRMVLVDRRLTHLAVGRPPASAGAIGGPAPLAVAASADALPFREGAFEWSFSHLFFHHFGGRENRAVLAEMLRCSRAGAAVVDLRRSRLAAWLARLLFPFLGIGRVALHDGLLSLAQSWTVAEVADLVGEGSGLPVLELRRRFPFRWSLVIATGDPSPPGSIRSRRLR